MKLKMGTRGSALALAQSAMVARALEKARPGLAVETVVIKTSGDLFSTQAPKEAVAAAGGKGLFVKEIEEALLDWRLDFAVHSAKDLPAELARGLAVAAYPEREDPRDAFLGRGGAAWAALPAGARVGTSSLRRQVQLGAARPDLVFAPMRGNVDTRLRKLEEGEFDGLVLALAGLKRLGRAGVPHEALPESLMVPAPGQGALAVEARAERLELVDALSALDHAPTRREVECERAFLAAAGGGCSTPLGALARSEGGALSLTAFWATPDGKVRLRERASCAGPADAAALARAMSGRLAAR